MKKFTKILICLMLCVFGFGLVACDNRTPKEKNFVYPSLSDAVNGNGGLAVTKGNYIYFVNGYQSVSSITNKKASYTLGSLMLMKLGANGEVVTDENGLLKDEYYITMSAALCGYEVTNLYIYGEYLYFATPCLENESGDKVWAKERVEFKRIKLDKTGRVEDVYSTGVKYDQLEYEFYESNSNLYILCWEKGGSYYNSNGNNSLIKVNASAKTSVKIANEVSSIAFGDNADEIFFVQDDVQNSRYYLKKLAVSNDAATNYTSFEETITAKFVCDGNVYITKNHEYGSTTDLMVSNIANTSGFELVHAYEGTATLDITPDGACVVLTNENVISLIKGVDDVTTIIDEDATSIEIIGYTNGSIVYHETTDEKTNIKMVSYYNHLNDAGDKTITTLATVDAIEEDYAYFDLDDRYLYFYKKEGSNYYLNRLKVNNNMDETEEMIGIYLTEDAPVVEEDEEIEEE